jgi:hypothetical protein
LGITHLLHVTPIIKLLDEIIQLDGANYPQILAGPFGGSIHFFHVPQQWCGVKTLGEKIVLNFEDCPPNVGGPNHTPCMINPLMIITLFFLSLDHVPFPW